MAAVQRAFELPEIVELVVRELALLFGDVHTRDASLEESPREVCRRRRALRRGLAPCGVVSRLWRAETRRVVREDALDLDEILALPNERERWRAARNARALFCHRERPAHSRRRESASSSTGSCRHKAPVESIAVSGGANEARNYMALSNVKFGSLERFCVDANADDLDAMLPTVLGPSIRHVSIRAGSKLSMPLWWHLEVCCTNLRSLSIDPKCILGDGSSQWQDPATKAFWSYMQSKPALKRLEILGDAKLMTSADELALLMGLPSLQTLDLGETRLLTREVLAACSVVSKPFPQLTRLACHLDADSLDCLCTFVSSIKHLILSLHCPSRGALDSCGRLSNLKTLRISISSHRMLDDYLSGVFIDERELVRFCHNNVNLHSLRIAPDDWQQSGQCFAATEDDREQNGGDDDDGEGDVDDEATAAVFIHTLFAWTDEMLCEGVLSLEAPRSVDIKPYRTAAAYAVGTRTLLRLLASPRASRLERLALPGLFCLEMLEQGAAALGAAAPRAFDRLEALQLQRNEGFPVDMDLMDRLRALWPRLAKIENEDGFYYDYGMHAARASAGDWPLGSAPSAAGRPKRRRSSCGASAC